MLTGAAPASCVTSTITRAPTSRARATTAATSTRVPVAYCTALKQTAVVRSPIASTSDAVSSSSGRSSAHVTAIPSRAWAFSHG